MPDIKILDKKGYTIEISHWAGQFGNHIIQLSCAINLAMKTESLLRFPSHQFFNKTSIDFRKNKSTINAEVIKGEFFMKMDCFQHPIEYDFKRRLILQEFIIPLIFTSEQITRINQPDIEYDLVINIRSGDVFRKDWQSKEAVSSGLWNYVQPPLAYYNFILNSRNYKKVLIITQPDLKNPVISQLLKNKKITLKKHISPIDDILSIMRAKELVISHSTFSWCAALMSSNLNKLHQTHYVKLAGVTDYGVVTYHFPDYIKRGDWNSSKKNMNKMLNYNLEQIFCTTENRNKDLEVSISQIGTIGNTFVYDPDFYYRTSLAIARTRKKINQFIKDIFRLNYWILLFKTLLFKLRKLPY